MKLYSNDFIIVEHQYIALFKMYKNSTFISILLAYLSYYNISIAAEDQPSAYQAIRTQLEQEFKQAYPEQIIANGEVKKLELVAAETQWGVFPPYQTNVWAYNGQVPAPVIRIQLGDTLELKLTNRLPQPTTIHWHGIRVPNAMDGVPGVTQPKIAVGESFVYRFTPKDAGTFWFHPHFNSAEQIERGLYGVLIVEDSNEPQYSQDLVMVLDDWLLEKNAQIYDQFVTRHDLAHDGRWGNLQTVNGRHQPVIPVTPGERIRLRLVNVANGRVFSPAFPDLSPQIFAVDGMLAAQPFPLNNFLLSPGNRIDLDITIPNTYAGKKLEIINTFSRKPTRLAILQVAKNAPVETPQFKPPQAKHFPNWLKAAYMPVTQHYELDAKRGGKYGISWTINDQAWPDSTTQTLEYGRFTRIRLSNKSARLHPMHLHGQFFRVIARNGAVERENFWRDTVLLKRRETVDIVLMPIDKGLWAHHCHILEHAEAGMMNMIKVE